MSRKLDRHIWLAFVTTGMCLTTPYVHSAGYALIENSASGMGNAFAGAAAVAEDASTIYFNPAGMSYLPKSEILIAGHLVAPESKFTDKGSIRSNGDPMEGAKTSEAGSSALIPNFYIAHQLDKDVTLGFGVNVPFGMTTEYDDDWVGRYHGVLSELAIVNLNPSIALKLNEKLSVGAGINYQHADVTLTSAVDFSGACLSAGFSLVDCQNNLSVKDGFADIEGDGWGSGFNLGAILQLNKNSRIGLSFRSSVRHDLKGTANFSVDETAQFVVDSTGLFKDADVQADLELPATASISAVHELFDSTQFLFDLTWTEWSDFQELRIDYTNTEQPDSVTSTKWDDAYRVSVGVTHEVSSRLKLRAGTAYDQTPIPDEKHRTPRIPGDDRIWISAGVGYSIAKNLHFDAGYTYIYTSTAKTENQFESSIDELNHTVKGEYESSINILSAQLRWMY